MMRSAEAAKSGDEWRCLAEDWKSLLGDSQESARCAERAVQVVQYGCEMTQCAATWARIGFPEKALECVNAAEEMAGQEHASLWGDCAFVWRSSLKDRDEMARCLAEQEKLTKDLRGWLDLARNQRYTARDKRATRLYMEKAEQLAHDTLDWRRIAEEWRRLLEDMGQAARCMREACVAESLFKAETWKTCDWTWRQFLFDEPRADECARRAEAEGTKGTVLGETTAKCGSD